MGILTDFVIAPRDDADAIGESLRPADRWPTLEGKGVDTIKITALYCVLTDQDYDDDLHDSIRPVAGDVEDGPWVFEIPADFVKEFAGLDAEDIPEVAEAWAETEELEMDGWGADDAAAFITELREHAQKSLDAKASLFLWLSL